MQLRLSPVAGWIVFMIIGACFVPGQTCNHDRWNKTYLLSKESAFDGSHLFWGPGVNNVTASLLEHWQPVPADGRLIMYLRNVDVDDDGPQYGPNQLRALRFSGDHSSYATVLHDNGTNGGLDDVQADMHFTWYFEVKPASGGSGEGVLLEYSDCYNPLRVEQVNGLDIRVTVGDNLGETHTVQVSGILREANWTRVAITFKFDEAELKVIDFHPDFEEPLETLLPICEVNRARRMNATGDVRLGASYNPDLPNFNGSLGCIQFFRGYLLKNYESIPLFCDPQLSNAQMLDVVEYFKEEDTSNLIIARACPFDEVTTEGPTTESPSTMAPSTELPTTELESTMDPTTESPTTVLEPITELPTTELESTMDPTTESPTTELEPTTELPTAESPSTMAPTTEALTTETRSVQQSTTEMSTSEPTTYLPTAADTPTTPSLQPRDECVAFHLVWSGVDLDPSLPLLSTTPAHSSSRCAQMCFHTHSCSAMGFDGTHCYLTTAASLSQIVFPSTGLFDFFSMR